MGLVALRPCPCAAWRLQGFFMPDEGPFAARTPYSLFYPGT